jgi:hypothetical protein
MLSDDIYIVFIHDPVTIQIAADLAWWRCRNNIPYHREHISRPVRMTEPDDAIIIRICCVGQCTANVHKVSLAGRECAHGECHDIVIRGVGCEACKDRTWRQGGVEAVDGHGDRGGGAGEKMQRGNIELSPQRTQRAQRNSIHQNENGTRMTWIARIYTDLEFRILILRGGLAVCVI